jgi:DNA-binding beta-propeller fold protein YncE
MTTILPRWWPVVGVTLVTVGCATATPPPARPDYVWPLAPETPRIRYLETFASSEHWKAETRNWVKDAVLGPDGKNGSRMMKPYGVATDRQGRIYVSDTGLGQVWVFDTPAKQVRFIGNDGPTRLVTPAGVVVDAQGTVFVADTKLDRVFGFDQTGKVVMAIGQNDEFYSPSGLALDGRTSRLYVTDTGRHKVRVYDSRTGSFLFEFGTRGTGPAEFNFPTHVSFRHGRLYVTDTMNFRVQVLMPDGRFVRQYGAMGANFGQLARPKGVAVDSEGHVYVIDAAFGNFQIFDPEGDLLLFVGRTGAQPGEFWLPAGLHIDDHDRIYVVDQYNRRVQAFQYLGDGELATINPKAVSKPEAKEPR